MSRVIDSIQRSQSGARGYRNCGVYCAVMHGGKTRQSHVHPMVNNKPMMVFLSVSAVLITSLLAGILYMVL